MDPKLAKETSRIWLWEKHLFHVNWRRGTSLIQPLCKSQIQFLKTTLDIKVCKLGCDEILFPPFEKEQPLLWNFQVWNTRQRNRQTKSWILNSQGLIVQIVCSIAIELSTFTTFFVLHVSSPQGIKDECQKATVSLRKSVIFCLAIG